MNDVDPITYNIHCPADERESGPDILPTHSLYSDANPQPENESRQREASENAASDYMD